MRRGRNARDRRKGGVQHGVRLALEPREFAPTQLLDAAFASVLELGRRGTQQPLYPLRVELKRNPAHSEIYESYYGCRMRFKARRNAILFRTADLDRPFVTYHAELRQTLHPLLDRELAKLKAGHTLTDQVKWIHLRHL